MKTAIVNAAQNPEYTCLTPQAVLEELEALSQDKSVYEFLQQEVVDGYHDHEEFVRVAEGEYLDVLDEEVREAMGLVSEKQYRSCSSATCCTSRLDARASGCATASPAEMERPDEEMMARDRVHRDGQGRGRGASSAAG